MRLICPNCGAKYEVADDAIPPGGREVQCSNCAETWFQSDTPDDAPQIAADTMQETDAPAPLAADDLKPARKPLDSAVAKILQEEAARGETMARGGNAAPPPTQAAARPAEVIDADVTRQRIAQMTVEEGGTTTGASSADAAKAAAAAAQAASLRSIPDIHEINAALRARAQASDTSGLTETEKAEAAERRGFRGGFFFVLLLIALAIVPYFFADQITQNLPQTAEFMGTYMETVDNLRSWLSSQISGLRGGGASET